MFIRSIDPWRSLVHLGAIVAVGSLAGTVLASYATGGGLLQERWAETERPILGNPDALVADRHPIPIGAESPAFFVCTGCGPGINEQRASEAQRRLDILISRNARSTDSYDDYRYTNVDYSDGYDDRTAAGAAEQAGEADAVWSASRDASVSVDRDEADGEAANASVESPESDPIDTVDFARAGDTASER